MMPKSQLLERALHQHRIQPAGQEQYQWNYHYHKTMSQLTGSEQQKQSIIRKRILRYFGQFNLQSQSYHSIRNDVNYTDPMLQVLVDKIVLFGIDYMSVQKAKKYFEGFSTNIRRMDDSHYVVEFRSQGDCIQALNRKGTCLEKFGGYQDVFRNSDMGWVQMQPYYQFIFQRKLMARFLTNMDKIDNFCYSTKHSFNLAYSEAKRRFFKSLQEDLQSEEKQRMRNLRLLKNSPENHSRSNSKERSRQKRQKTENYQFSNRMDRFNGRRHHRNFERSRSRSKSPSLDMYDVKGHLIVPQLIQQQRIKESNFKFQLYIKKRDKDSRRIQVQAPSRTSAPAQTLAPAPKSKPPAVAPPKKSNDPIQNTQKSHSTNQCEKQTMQNENRNEDLDTSELNFTTFLRNLKLSDSKNQYSAFDLEEIQ